MTVQPPPSLDSFFLPVSLTTYSTHSRNNRENKSIVNALHCATENEGRRPEEGSQPRCFVHPRLWLRLIRSRVSLRSSLLESTADQRRSRVGEKGEADAQVSTRWQPRPCPLNIPYIHGRAYFRPCGVQRFAVLVGADGWVRVCRHTPPGSGKSNLDGFGRRDLCSRRYYSSGWVWLKKK